MYGMENGKSNIMKAAGEYHQSPAAFVNDRIE